MEKQVFIFGHSLTLGMWDSEGGWADRLKKELMQEFHNSDNYYEVYNLGIADEDSSQLRDRIEEELDRRNYEDAEKYIIIQIGANDIQYFTEEGEMRVSKEDFRENIEKIIDTANDYGKPIVVSDGYTSINGSIPDFEEIEVTDDRLEDYVSTLEKICLESDVEFVNLRKKISKDEWISNLEDGFHPGMDIHEEIFELLKKKIEEIGESV